jgi:hypothetical protein
MHTLVVQGNGMPRLGLLACAAWHGPIEVFALPAPESVEMVPTAIWVGVARQGGLLLLAAGPASGWGDFDGRRWEARCIGCGPFCACLAPPCCPRQIWTGKELQLRLQIAPNGRGWDPACAVGLFS